jgi:hypothetical protein
MWWQLLTTIRNEGDGFILCRWQEMGSYFADGNFQGRDHILILLAFLKFLGFDKVATGFQPHPSSSGMQLLI